MAIKVKIFYPELQQLIPDPESVMVNGKTVGECIDDLLRQYPDARHLIFDKQGKLLKQVYIYVNAEGLDKANFARTVTDRDHLILAVLLTGG